MAKVKTSTYEKCKSIQFLIAQKVGEVLAYETWTDEYRMQTIREIPETVKKWGKGDDNYRIDPNGMTVEEYKDLGFGRWNDETEIRLIPIWLWPFLADEFESVSIDGTRHFKKSEMDPDHRFGCIAYGVYPFPFSHSEPSAG